MQENDELSALREAARRFHVAFVTRPKQAVADGQLVTVGYDVDLTATHDHPHGLVSPGCVECEPVLATLDALAKHALPKGKHEALYEITVRRGALVFGRTHGGVAEVSATISVTHRTGVGARPGPCEDECLAAIVEGLEKLGVRRQS